MCKTEKVKLEISKPDLLLLIKHLLGKIQLKSMDSQVALGKDSLNTLEKSCVEFYCCTLAEKVRPGRHFMHSRRKVAQSSVYFLLCRFNPHFAQSRQDTPIH